MRPQGYGILIFDAEQQTAQDMGACNRCRYANHYAGRHQQTGFSQHHPQNATAHQESA